MRVWLLLCGIINFCVIGHSFLLFIPFRLRQVTWKELQYFNKGEKSLSGELAKRLQQDPLSPVLHPKQISVLNERLSVIVNVIEKCFQVYGQESVLI